MAHTSYELSQWGDQISAPYMSDPIEELASDLGVEVRHEGSMALIASQDCEKIIRACETGRTLILGIEAFRLAQGYVIPDSDLIADFTALYSKEWGVECAEAGRAAEIYLSNARNPDLWFEF